MPEEWIVRVEGREYGPVELEVLREWKEEGRVLPTNQARRSDAADWTKASEIPGLFQVVTVPPKISAASRARRRSFGKILRETLRIYGKGFPQFFCLTLLVIIPSVCGQLIDSVLQASSTVTADFRMLLAGGFSFCMLLLVCVAWPIYLSGIQILTTEIVGGRRLGFLALLNEAIKFWPRVAALCLLVYGAFFLLILLAMGIVVMIMVGSSSLVVITLALILLVFQVWMFGRVFINVLFWQQVAVLDRADVVNSLRESKKLARSGSNLSWFQRPLWRGVFIASLWVAFVLALNLPLIWPAFRIYFNTVATSQDPQVLMQALAAGSKAQGLNFAALGINLLQEILRPLLGIAFVLVYFEATAAAAAEVSSD